MNFASDNAGPVHPKVMEALIAANEGYVKSYGGDDLTANVVSQIRALFDAPDAAVYLVATGTAANALALASLCPPWGTVFCSPVAHIQEDECNAPEFYTAGAKLTLVDGTPDAPDQMTPETLHAAIAASGGSVHNAQRGPVSLTQVGEKGNTYTLDDIKALCAVAKGFDLPVFMDGARFANAIAKLGCSPADMTWKAGVDAVAFGGTKNGLMGVEAVVFFNPQDGAFFEFRRKRAAQLFSKHRFLAAQMQAYLTDDLWLDMARAANARAAQLQDGLTALGVNLRTRTAANLLFFDLPRSVHRSLADAGAVYYSAAATDGPPDEMLTGRLVCDWSITREAVQDFLDHVRDAL